MKIPINLASQPFRRDRAMLAASIAVSLMLVGTLGALISLIMADRALLADVRSDVDGLNRQIRAATAEQERLDAVLRKPENAEVLERSVFLNALLYRKGISWTRIFADLEKTVPYNVKVLAIRPSVNSAEPGDAGYDGGSGLAGAGDPALQGAGGVSAVRLGYGAQQPAAHAVGPALSLSDDGDLCPETLSSREN